MNIKRKLQNPYALVAQGFVAGAIIFYATMPAELESQAPRANVQSASAAEVSRA